MYWVENGLYGVSTEGVVYGSMSADFHYDGEQRMDTTEIESRWESEGYAVERKTFPPHHSAQPHSHPFDARVLILAGAFTLTSQGQSRTFYPGEQFEVAAGCMHSEQHGPEGSTFLIARKHSPTEV
jgi:quercetin dioxygenase-like cupin family protein